VGGSIFKPNPYVELSVDEKNPRKTEVVKCTYQPKWNEEFTVYVPQIFYIISQSFINIPLSIRRVLA
jgi:hypothetical protein